ncbi:MAG TPA: sugar ABC transporter permease [Marmoricola sp.]|nr:sugar ABC transporter permease [Marmoricola sp.]
MRRREFAMFAGPSILVMSGLLLLPLYRTVQWSLQKVDYGSPGEFVGLDNYRQAFSNSRLADAAVFTVTLTLLVTAVLLVAGYVLAVLVNGLGRAKPYVLGLLLVPYVIPHIVGASMFLWLFNSNYGGVVTYVIEKLTGVEILWMTDTWANRILLAMNITWAMLPFAMLIIVAGLQGVPDEILEAAKMDGASLIRTHLSVIVPSIRGVLGFVALISIMDVVRVFDPLVALSPSAVQIGNESIMLYIYNVAFRDGGQNLGLGSAINVLLIILIVILLFPFIRGVAKEAKTR